MSSSDKGQEAGRAARGHKTSRPTLKAEAGAGHSPKAGTAINDVARPPGRPFPNVVFLTKVSANDDQVRTYGDATKRRLQSRHPTETLSGPRSGQTHRSKPLKPARGATQPLARPAQGKGPANVRKRIDHPTVGLDRYFYGKLSIKQNSQIKKPVSCPQVSHPKCETCGLKEKVNGWIQEQVCVSMLQISWFTKRHLQRETDRIRRKGFVSRR